MELKELEERMHEFVTSKGWYEAKTPKEQTPRNLAISLALRFWVDLYRYVLHHFIVGYTLGV